MSFKDQQKAVGRDVFYILSHNVRRNWNKCVDIVVIRYDFAM